MRWVIGPVVAALMLTGGVPAAAQDREATLADIRQQLSVLYVDVQRLE